MPNEKPPSGVEQIRYNSDDLPEGDIDGKIDTLREEFDRNYAKLLDGFSEVNRRLESYPKGYAAHAISSLKVLTGLKKTLDGKEADVNDILGAIKEIRQLCVDFGKHYTREKLERARKIKQKLEDYKSQSNLAIKICDSRSAEFKIAAENCVGGKVSEEFIKRLAMATKERRHAAADVHKEVLADLLYFEENYLMEESAYEVLLDDLRASLDKVQIGKHMAEVTKQIAAEMKEPVGESESAIVNNKEIAEKSTEYPELNIIASTGLISDWMQRGGTGVVAISPNFYCPGCKKFEPILRKFVDESGKPISKYTSGGGKDEFNGVDELENLSFFPAIAVFEKGRLVKLIDPAESDEWKRL